MAKLDFAVVPGPPDDPHISSHTICQVQFTWVAAPSRIRSGTLLAAKEFENHPVITMTEGSGLTRAFDAWAAEQGLKFQRILASNSLMAIVGLTIADVGISFLPHDYVQPWIKRGNLVALRSNPPLPSLNYCFLQRADDNRSIVQVMQRYALEEADFSHPSEMLD